MRAVRDFTTGVRGFWRGVQWFTQHPGMMILALVPFALAISAFAGGMWAFWSFGSDWLTQMMMSWFSDTSQNILVNIAFVIIKALMWFSALLLCLVIAIALAGVVASPVYEVISQRVERELLGDQQHMVPWSRLIKVMAGEAVKVMIVIFIPLVMLVIPGVNIFASIAAAFLLGWDFYDYPLARRGWTFGERWRFVRGEFWTVLGFGIWLIIPVVHIFLVPLAIAGGTILNVEALQRRGLATPKLGSS